VSPVYPVPANSKDKLIFPNLAIADPKEVTGIPQRSIALVSSSEEERIFRACCQISRYSPTGGPNGGTRRTEYDELLCRSAHLAQLLNHVLSKR
jgi:hypothetical protein